MNAKFAFSIRSAISFANFVCWKYVDVACVHLVVFAEIYFGRQKSFVFQIKMGEHTAEAMNGLPGKNLVFNNGESD